MRRVVGLVGLVFVSCGFAFGQASKCPTIKITGPSSVQSRPGERIVSSVSVERFDAVALKYKWYLDRGTIIDGHNSETISVDTTGLNNQNLTVTVEVAGLPGECVPYSSESHFVGGGGHPELVDEFEGVSKRAENARFDKLGRRMKDEPRIGVYIIRYYPKLTKHTTIAADEKRIYAFLNTRWSVERKRVVIISAAFAGNYRTKIYLAPFEPSDLPKK